jgi:hypothetical protein
MTDDKKKDETPKLTSECDEDSAFEAPHRPVDDGIYADWGIDDEPKAPAAPTLG